MPRRHEEGDTDDEKQVQTLGKVVAFARWALPIVAGVAMLVAGVRGFMYSHTEGLALEAKVANLEKRLETNEVETRQNIAHIRDKIDEVYKILIENRSRD